MTDGQNVGAINVIMGLDSSKFKTALGMAQGQTNAFASMAKGAFAGIAAGFSLGAVISQLQQAYQASTEYLKLQRQVNQTLLTTGYASGMTADQINQLARSMDSLTGVSQSTVIEAENILLTYKRINQDVFPETIQLAEDISATLGTDLKDNVEKLGKALEDPIKGVRMLRSVGVMLTSQQQEQIKTFMKAGESAKAQALILEEVRGKYEGAAEAARTHGKSVTTNLEDIQREIGLLMGGSNPLTAWLDNVTKGFKNWAYSIRITNNEIKDLGLTDLQNRLQKVFDKQNQFNEQSSKLTWNKKAIADQNKAYDDEAKAIVNQIKLIREKDKANKETGDKTQAGLDFNTGADTKSKKNPALDEYKSFIEEYKQATRDYEATLKAKKYVEETLGMSAIQVDKADYDNAINAYKDYYSKIAEINQSQTINKSILLKKNEEKLQEDLKLITLTKTQEALIAQNELIKNYQEQSRSINNANQAESELGGFMGSFQSGYAQKLEILKWYLAERDKINDMANQTAAQRQEAWNQLDILQTQKMAEVNKQVVADERQRIADIFGNSLDTMLTNYGGFSASMKQLVLNLGRELLNYELKQAIESVNIKQWEAMAKKAIDATMGVVTGGVSNVVSGVGNFLGGLVKGSHHSGGYQLPGTAEQLKILKGGERVLSPAETTAYNNGQSAGGQGSTIVYAPVVKAMDSKDVATWFNENKYQIINIMTNATRDNIGGYRNVVKAV